MHITDIKIRQIFNEYRLKAIVSVTLEDIAIHDIKIIARDDRLFVAMPNFKDKYGIRHDIVHPINKESREQLENSIIEAYNNYIEQIYAFKNGN